jgi:hypothetical protein
MRSMVEGHPPRLLTKKVSIPCTCPSTSLRLASLPGTGRNDA